MSQDKPVFRHCRFGEMVFREHSRGLDRQGWISVPRNLPNEEWAEEMLDAGADAYIAFKQEHGSRAGLGELLRVAYHAMLAAAPQINEPPQTTTPAPASVGGKPASGSPDIQQALGEKP